MKIVIECEISVSKYYSFELKRNNFEFFSFLWNSL